MTTTLTAPADHYAAAFRCQEQPGTELLVNVYANRQGADAVARGINSGKFPAYQPGGTFQASAHPHEAGWAVWARCTDGVDLPPLAETMTVRVPDYGRQTGQEGVRVVEVEISARCQTCGGPRGETRPDTFVRDGVRHTRDAWDNSCGHKDPSKAVLREALRRRQALHGESRREEIEPVDGGQYAKAVTLLVEWIAENPWLGAKRAMQKLEGRRQHAAAAVIREFALSNPGGLSTSARSAALYLNHLDSLARDTADDATTTTGGSQ
ncbi:hypothetical protein ACFY64_31435 [Streptomyces collinus]|uniref:hypothetical protein n=1 Tax=Streptomyces collinus TaxID=42684 RepID=UPI0036AF2F51